VVALGFGVGRRQAITLSGLVSRPARIVGNAAMAPVASAGFPAAQFHESQSRSAAVRV